MDLLRKISVVDTKIKVLVASVIVLIPAILYLFGIWIGKGLKNEDVVFVLSYADLLSFYGGYLAFCGTITLGAISLWQNDDLSISNTAHEEKLQKEVVKAQDRLTSVTSDMIFAYEKTNDLYERLVNIQENKQKPKIAVSVDNTTVVSSVFNIGNKLRTNENTENIEVNVQSPNLIHTPNNIRDYVLSFDFHIHNIGQINIDEVQINVEFDMSNKEYIVSSQEKNSHTIYKGIRPNSVQRYILKVIDNRPESDEVECIREFFENEDYNGIVNVTINIRLMYNGKKDIDELSNEFIFHKANYFDGERIKLLHSAMNSRK